MCLIAWHWQPDHETPLLLLGNRDEFYARPTQSVQWWNDAPVLAGRDLQAGGTWLGVNRRGQLAALTNYRDPLNNRDNAPSRGALVTDFLTGDWSSPTYLNELAGRCGDFNPFNLLVFDGQHLMGLESRHARVLAMAPGTGAVSNADFHTPWPKVNRLHSGLEAAVAAQATTDAELLAWLHNDQQALDADLPSTGLDAALERALSAAFITTPNYGTRACSIVRMGRHEVSFVEESFNVTGRITSERQVFRPRA
jgi:uncharacterized protein with NRDE domain